jgi:hypothetical protein
VRTPAKKKARIEGVSSEQKKKSSPAARRPSKRQSLGSREDHLRNPQPFSPKGKTLSSAPKPTSLGSSDSHLKNKMNAPESQDKIKKGAPNTSHKKGLQLKESAGETSKKASDVIKNALKLKQEHLAKLFKEVSTRLSQTHHTRSIRDK